MHDDWYILSAKHGLLASDGLPIEPYNETLAKASAAEQREWAQRVAREMNEEGLLNKGNTLVIHAGKAYYEELLPLLEDRDITVELPLEGLRQGERLRWYNEHR